MRAHRSRGLSLVELLIGTTAGLVVVAAASSLVLQHLRESRAMLIDTRLTQDLRTAADIVTRDLRRAGFWASVASGVRGDDGSAAIVNPYGAVTTDPAASASVRFSFSRDAGENGIVDGNERFGFRLRGGAIELQLGDANWQALTDPATLVVTAFHVEPRVDEVSLAGFCAAPCAAASATCPPRQQVRNLAVEITGHSANDASVIYSVRSGVRLRTTSVVGDCEG